MTHLPLTYIISHEFVHPLKNLTQGTADVSKFNSLLAAVFNTFPNTTFSQNNGVIQTTGVGNRYVEFYVAGIFVVLGLLSVVGGIFQAIPQPVLGGATVVMFGSIAVAGINIVTSSNIDRRALIIVAVSLALGLGVVYVPEILDGKPAFIRNIFSSGISTGGLTAVILNWLLPYSSSTDSAPTPDPSIDRRLARNRNGRKAHDPCFRYGTR